MSRRYHPYRRSVLSRREDEETDTLLRGFAAVDHLGKMAAMRKSMHRRRRRRRPRRGNTIVNVARGFYNQCFGFPDRILTKLRYDDVITLTSTSGSIGKQVFGMNNCFDPDVTGTGHQPLYFDQFSAIYNQYAVVKSKIKVRLAQELSSNKAMIVGIVGDDNGTTSSTFSTLMEQSHGNTKVLGIGSADSLSYLSQKFHCKKMLTIDPYTSETYKTAIGSSPTEAWDVLVWTITMDGTTTQTIRFIVEIQFTVLFTELKDVSQS